MDKKDIIYMNEGGVQPARVEHTSLDDIYILSYIRSNVEYNKSYKIKAVRSGRFIEIYHYEKEIHKSKGIDVFYSGYSRKLEAKRWGIKVSKIKVRRFIYKNFKNKDKFITLTFDKNRCIFDINDIKLSTRAVNNFIIKLNKFYGYNIKYLYVPEFHKSGQVHFHMIADFTYEDQDFLQYLWGYGILDIRAIKNLKDRCEYLIKYITKNANDPLFIGTRKYRKSNNLEYSQILYNIGAFNLECMLKRKVNYYKSITYYNEWVGNCTLYLYWLGDG